MERLNPTLGADAFNQAVAKLTQGRSPLSLARANRQVHHLLKDGIPVTVRDETGQEVERRADMIDWRYPFENDFRLGVFWHTQGSGKSISMVFFS